MELIPDRHLPYTFIDPFRGLCSIFDTFGIDIESSDVGWNSFMDKPNVPIRHVGLDTIQILESSDTEIADKRVEFLKRTGNSTDAWKEMLNYYLLLWPSLFCVYHVHGSCSFCGLVEEYKGYSKVEFICTDVSKLTEETASVLQGEEHMTAAVVVQIQEDQKW
jgi:hypothetical protein